jgi:hypothetical protein
MTDNHLSYENLEIIVTAQTKINDHPETILSAVKDIESCLDHEIMDSLLFELYPGGRNKVPLLAYQYIERDILEKYLERYKTLPRYVA